MATYVCMRIANAQVHEYNALRLTYVAMYYNTYRLLHFGITNSY